MPNIFLYNFLGQLKMEQMNKVQMLAYFYYSIFQGQTFMDFDKTLDCSPNLKDKLQHQN